MFGYSRFHSGRYAQGFMNMAEIVIREVQGDSGFQVVQLFRESIGQSGKPSHCHPHGQILPFHVRRADMLLIRVALYDLGYALHDWAWGVFSRVVMLAVISVQLHKLCKIHVCPKLPLNRVNVKPESVCSDLDAIGEPLCQVANEKISCPSGTFADDKRGNEFGFRINRHKYPLVAKFFRVVFADSALLFKAECPNLITLDEVAFQVPHSFIREPSAAFPGESEQTHNRVAMQPCKPLCRANRASLKQALNRLHRFGFVNPHRAKRASGLGVRKGCRAGCAAVTLDSVTTVTAKLLNGGVLAFNARHGAFPLEFLREKPENEIGSESWLTPRFGLVPAKGATDAGTLAYRVNRLWWGSVASHIPLPSFLKRSALLSQGVSYLLPKSFLTLNSGGRANSAQSFDCLQHRRLICAIPLVGNAALSRKTLKGLVNERKCIGITAKVISGFNDRISHVRGRDWEHRAVYHALHYICQAYLPNQGLLNRFYGCRIRGGSSKRTHKLLQPSNLCIPVIALCNCIGQINLCLLQSRFVRV